MHPARGDSGSLSFGEADARTSVADLVLRGRAADHEATLRDVGRFWEAAQATVQRTAFLN